MGDAKDPSTPIFPPEIQSVIINYLSVDDMAKYRAVNSYWCRILSQLCWRHILKFSNLNFYRGASFKYLRRILEHVNEPIDLLFAKGDLKNGTELQELRKIPNLRGLRFVQCYFPNDYIQKLAEFTNLTSLNLYIHNSPEVVELQDYIHFSSLTNLRHLDLDIEDPSLDLFLLAHLTALTCLERLPFLLNSDSIVDLASQFKNITSITVSDSFVTDSGIRSLINLQNLNRLHLEKCSSVTDSVVKDFSVLKNLKDVAISGCSSLTADALNGFSNTTQLEQFQLIGCPYINSISPLGNCTNLRLLKLSQCYVETWGLASLHRFEHLETLNCNNFVQLKDPALRHFNLTSLRVLNLRGASDVTDEGLKFLSDLTDLQHLELGICEKITDEGLKHLERLVGLTYLGMLSLVRITDVGIQHLTGLTRLSHVDLSVCRVTDASIRLFVNRKLYKLDIDNCPNITKKGYDLRNQIANYDYDYYDNW